MTKMTYIAKPAEIPADKKYVLVMYGRNTGKHGSPLASRLPSPVNNQRLSVSFPS